MNMIPVRATSDVAFLSPWSLEGAASEERHEMFRAMVIGLMQTHCPWLLRILEKTDAQILARVGAFYVAIPAGSHDWIEVPELSSWLVMVPWKEAEEQPQ